jgi:hypothetical protein
MSWQDTREPEALLRHPIVMALHESISTLRPFLTRILASKLRINAVFVVQVRDELDALCRRFDAEIFEEYESAYLPCFDALALLNQALACRPIDLAPCEQALKRLESLERLLASGAI